MARSATQVPGIVLGVGIGGFSDGIVLHQLFEFLVLGAALVGVGTIIGHDRPETTKNV